MLPSRHPTGSRRGDCPLLRFGPRPPIALGYSEASGGALVAPGGDSCLSGGGRCPPLSLLPFLSSAKVTRSGLTLLADRSSSLGPKAWARRSGGGEQGSCPRPPRRRTAQSPKSPGLPRHPSPSEGRSAPISFRPQVGRGYPLNLSISLSGGKETKEDSQSNGERNGKSPAPNPPFRESGWECGVREVRLPSEARSPKSVGIRPHSQRG